MIVINESERIDTDEVRKNMFWCIFRMKGVGEEGLSVTNLYELKKLLGIGRLYDCDKLDVVNKAIRNYKRMKSKKKKREME